MSRLNLNPYYCPEDKDILDFVRSTNAPVEQLISFLQHRGVHVSERSTRESLAELISQEVFTWKDILTLTSLVVTPTMRERTLSSSHTSEASFELLEEAVEKVAASRSAKRGDTIKIIASGPGKYIIDIEFSEIFYEKTRLIQSVELDAEIVIESTDDGFIMTRTAGDVPKEIELAILGEFELLAKAHNQALVTTRLLLSHLQSLKSKVRFFTHLMERIDGYAFEQITSVRVRSAAKHELNFEAGDEEDPAASNIESIVINGKNVGASELYEQCIEKGYFPMSATWRCAADTGDYGRVELQAVFVPEGKDFQLEMAVPSVWARRDGQLQPKSKPNQVARQSFRTKLWHSAEHAIRTATAEIQTS